MPIARQVELINNYTLIETALNTASETFVVHVAALEVLVSIMMIYPIKKLLLVTLVQNKTPTKVLIE